MNLIFTATGETDAYFDTLKAICGDTSNKSMIDIGSGFCPTTRKLGFKEKRYVDIVERDLGEEKHYFVHMDILSMVKSDSDKNYDVSISLDNIEHFWKEDAFDLISWMESNSKKQIIFTPLGDYLTIKDKNNKDPDTHKSGWMPTEFIDRGWVTVTFPNFHPTLGIGAFFAFNCENIKEEFERITNELKNKLWAK